MALGTLYPDGRRAGQGGAQTLKVLHLEVLLVPKLGDPLERLLAVDGGLPARKGWSRSNYSRPGLGTGLLNQWTQAARIDAGKLFRRVSRRR
jgi:hypothetical protein